MRRIMLAVATLVIPVSAATVGLAGPSSPVSCTKVSGPATGTLTLKGCGGGLGKGTVPGPSLVNGSGTITWNGKHGGTTSISFTVTPQGQGGCAKNSTEYDANGTVTADTSGKVPVNSTVAARACVTQTGNVSLVKHTVFAL